MRESEIERKWMFPGGWGTVRGRRGGRGPGRPKSGENYSSFVCWQQILQHKGFHTTSERHLCSKNDRSEIFPDGCGAPLSDVEGGEARVIRNLGKAILFHLLSTTAQMLSYY